MRKHMHEIVLILVFAACACGAYCSSCCDNGDELLPGWPPKAAEHRGLSPEQAVSVMGGDIGECFGY